MRTLLYCVVLLGCGADGDTEAARLSLLVDRPLTEFDLPCLGHVSSAAPISPVVVANKYLYARYILDKNGIVPASEFCSVFRGLALHIASGNTVINPHGQEVSGYYSLTRGIVLGDSRGLLHEMLHHLDAKRWNIFSFAHAGWAENRYTESWREFWDTSLAH